MFKCIYVSIHLYIFTYNIPLSCWSVDLREPLKIMEATAIAYHLDLKLLLKTLHTSDTELRRLQSELT